MMVYDDLDELEPEEDATNEYGCPISQKEWDSLLAERDALRARVTKLEEEFYFQASLTKELMPYQERAVKAEADLAAAQKECDDALAAVDSNWVTHQQIVVLQQDLEAARARLDCVAERDRLAIAAVDGVQQLRIDLAAARAERDALRKDIERLRVQLAGCSVIAGSNTKRSITQAMPSSDAYGYSATLADVERCVRREIDLRAERDDFYSDYRMKCDKETKALTVERDALRHDIERHVAIAASQATEIDGLRALLQRLSGEVQAIWYNADSYADSQRGLRHIKRLIDSALAGLIE